MLVYIFLFQQVCFIWYPLLEITFFEMIYIEIFMPYQSEFNRYLIPVSYTHLRAHETDSYLVCRLLLEKSFFEIIYIDIFMPYRGEFNRYVF